MQTEKKLLQAQNWEKIRREPQPFEIITVYKPINGRTPIDCFIYCVLNSPKDQVEEILSETKISDDRWRYSTGLPNAQWFWAA